MFEEFVTVRLAALLRYATAITGEPELAKDLVQDVLIRAHRKWRRIERMDQPERYLQRMVYSDYISWARRAARRWRLANRVRDRPQTTVDHADVHAEHTDLWQRLMALPPNQRAALVLRYYEGLEDSEIAEVLGCATGSVRVFRARALTALRVDLAAVRLEEHR